ncbi:hypothetical protein ACVMIH_001725 [Bradyrhizobium sp. USDA 4503]
MLVTVKAGAKVDGHKFTEDSNQNLSPEIASKLLSDGRAKPVEFDAEGICRINTRYDAFKNEHGAIELQSGGDCLAALPGDFPLEHLPAVLAVYQTGHAHGRDAGRIKLQYELLNLLGAEPCKI